MARSELSLLICTAVILMLVKLALLTLPFASVLRLVGKFARSRRSHSQPSLRSSELVRSIETASRVIPGTRNCLVRALAAQLLFARAGCSCEMKFGVARNADGEFIAHAWLESEDRFLIGHPGSMRYTPLQIASAPREFSSTR